MEENSIEEALEKLSTGKKIKMYELLRTFKREGIENFVTTRKKYVDVILSDYKRVLKENEKKNKIIDLMENYMVENGWEICFDNIYAELNNCNGMERDWCRGDKLEKQDIHKYFSKKLLESEE